MSLPAAVQKQQDEADRLFKEQEVKEVAPIELDIDPELLKKEPADVIDIDPDNLNQPAKIVKEAPKPDENTEKITNLTAMNKKLDNENRTLKIKRGEYEREISDLKAEVVDLKAVQKEVPAVEPVSQKFSPDERQLFVDEGFAPELIDVFEKRGIQPAPQADNSRIETLEQELVTVKKDSAQTKNERFWTELDKAAPKWDSLNEDPGFAEFLGTIPLGSDMPLGQIMKEAQAKLDVPKIAQIFNAYEPIDGKAEEIPNVETPNLADLAAPKSSNAPAPSAQPGKWTTAQTTKFYNDVARNPGKYTPEAILGIEKKYIYPN